MLELVIIYFLLCCSVAYAGPVASFCSGSPPTYSGGTLAAAGAGYAQELCTISGDTTFDYTTLNPFSTVGIPFSVTSSKITTAAKLRIGGPSDPSSMRFAFLVRITGNKFTDGAAFVLYGSLPVGSSVLVAGNSFVSNGVFLSIGNLGVMATSLIWCFGNILMYDSLNSNFTIADNTFSFSPPSTPNPSGAILFPHYYYRYGLLQIVRNNFTVSGPDCTGDCNANGIYVSSMVHQSLSAYTTISNNFVQASNANAIHTSQHQMNHAISGNTLHVMSAGVALQLTANLYQSTFEVADNNFDVHADPGKNAIAAVLEIMSGSTDTFRFVSNTIISSGASNATNVAWANTRVYFLDFSPYYDPSSFVIAANTFTEADPRVTAALSFLTFNSMVAASGKVNIYANQIGDASVSGSARMFSFPMSTSQPTPYAVINICGNFFRERAISTDDDLKAVSVNWREVFSTSCTLPTESFTTTQTPAFTLRNAPRTTLTETPTTTTDTITTFTLISEGSSPASGYILFALVLLSNAVAQF